MEQNGGKVAGPLTSEAVALPADSCYYQSIVGTLPGKQAGG